MLGLELRLQMCFSGNMWKWILNVEEYVKPELRGLERITKGLIAMSVDYIEHQIHERKWRLSIGTSVLKMKLCFT